MRSRTLTSLPLVAIGGITPENAGEICLVKGFAVCVCAAVIAQAEPAQAARELRRIIARANLP
jgi:thiamine-phosphate pyrophosphorylase